MPAAPPGRVGSPLATVGTYAIPAVMALLLGWTFFFQSAAENGSGPDGGAASPADTVDGGTAGTTGGGPPPRHVVVITLDTTRADHMGFCGNPWIETPALDALARESIVFEDCTVTVPSTLASHTSIFTGKYPHRHGVPQNGFVVNADNVMLPEILAQAGFTTVGFIASFPLSKRFNFAQGFDHYDENFDLYGSTAQQNQRNQRRAREVTSDAIAYLEQHGIPPRLFLFVHYFDPHAPYDAYIPFRNKYVKVARAKPTYDLDPLRETLMSDRPRGLPQAEIVAAQYAGEISFMDQHLGRLVGYLRAHGVLDDALLLIVSDHGETLADGPPLRYFDHGWCVYQNNVRAVCMIRLPGGRQGGSRVRQVISTIDLLPTLVRRLGLALPVGIDGEALDLERLDRPATPRVRFAEASKPRTRAEAEGIGWPNSDKAQCVRDGAFKYIRTPHLNTDELYDLSADPLEERNLLLAPTPEQLARAKELRARLDVWNASADPLPSAFESSERGDTERRLQSLGYLQPRSDSPESPTTRPDGEGRARRPGPRRVPLGTTRPAQPP